MEAGIDSLAASEVVQQLNSQFEVELPATLLFDHPSVMALSTCVASELRSTFVKELAHSATSLTNLVPDNRNQHEGPPLLLTAAAGVVVASYN